MSVPKPRLLLSGCRGGFLLSRYFLERHLSFIMGPKHSISSLMVLYFFRLGRWLGYRPCRDSFVHKAYPTEWFAPLFKTGCRVSFYFKKPFFSHGQ